MKFKHFIILLLSITIIALAYSLYFIHITNKSELNMDRQITFSKLLNSISEKNCEQKILEFRSDLINKYGFYELYVFNVNRNYIGGGNFKEIDDFNYLLDMGLKWKGMGMTQLRNGKTAHWGRCSTNILFMALLQKLQICES
jgi:hypothetical protein